MQRWWRFAELDKLQALRLDRSPLDRRFGTATLTLDTAGAFGAPPLQLRFLEEQRAHSVEQGEAVTLAEELVTMRDKYVPQGAAA